MQRMLASVTEIAMVVLNEVKDRRFGERVTAGPSLRSGRQIVAAAVAALCAVTPASARCQTSPADVAFMQGMIGHHAQALRMTSLVADRTTRQDLRLLAEKIDVSQKDEIASMKRWLTDRKQSGPGGAMDHPVHDSGEHAMHMEPGMHMDMPALMPGMLTEHELAQLAATKGAEFDRQFLTFMIRHHEGALVMVKQLFATNGAGQESEIFRFASDRKSTRLNSSHRH